MNKLLTAALCFSLGFIALSSRADTTPTNAADAPANTTAAVPADAATNQSDLSGKISAPPATAENESVADTNAVTDTNSAPELGKLPLPATVTIPATNAVTGPIETFQTKLDLARTERSEKNPFAASATLIALLETNAPAEIKRLALFELALVNQDDGKFIKAQQIFSQYLHNYPEDASIPEVLLRQGLLYRQMGVNNLAVSKFYAVMSTCLKLKLDNMDYYKKLVLQSQIEIADTYYIQGEYTEASDFFSRIIKSGSPDLNREQIQFKLVRSVSYLTNYSDTVAKAQNFLDLYPNSGDIPEVRFLLATSLKRLGHNTDSMKQVLLLLQSQADNVHKNPETWIYWQQRAGNEIANQLYKEGDYLSALQIYLTLAELNKSPTWQLPVWYQTGLVYEQLQQWQKAGETYSNMMDRQKELTDADTTPSLKSLLDMAKWRKDYIEWVQRAKLVNASFQPPPANAAPPAVSQ